MGTDSTIDSEDFYLLMGRFGPPTLQPEDLPGGILGALHHSVAAAYFTVGDVVIFPNSDAAGLQGRSEFVYVKHVDEDDNQAFAAKQGMAPDNAGDPWDYTNDPDGSVGGVSGNPNGVFALTAHTANDFGWAWSGGVVPEDMIAGMGGNFATDGDVSAGDNLILQDLSTSAIGLGPQDHAAHVAIGYALAADAG